MQRFVSGIFAEWLTPFLRRPGIFPKPKAWSERLKPAYLSLEDPSGLLRSDLREAIQRAQEALLGIQDQEEGFWCSELRADTTLESDYVMLLHFIL